MRQIKRSKYMFCSIPEIDDVELSVVEEQSLESSTIEEEKKQNDKIDNGIWVIKLINDFLIEFGLFNVLNFLILISS